VFIRELVPRRAVAFLARFAYGENYSCVPMSHAISGHPAVAPASVKYTWGAGPALCSLYVDVAGPAFLPAEGSLSQFITEHYWGYAAQRDRACVEYEVQHPRWMVRGAKRAIFAGDAERYYGPQFAKVFTRAPDSAFLAEGSAVTVFRGCRIVEEPAGSIPIGNCPP
jgi:uncharacterized protein